MSSQAPDPAAKVEGHTPTPWQAAPLEDGCPALMIYDALGGAALAEVFDEIADGEPEANAEFLVRAVNAHAALVEALVDMIAITSVHPYNAGRVDKARAALKLAKS